MATKTISGRAEEKDPLFADAATHEQFGTSFGTHYADTLIQAAHQSCELPQPDHGSAVSRKKAAVSRAKQLCELPRNPTIGRMSDQETEDLIASRYA